MNRRNFLILPPLAAPVLLRTPLFAAAPSLPMPQQRISCFGRQWQVHEATDWKIENTAGTEVLSLNVPRPQEANPRAPIQYALLEQEPAGCFTLDVEVKGFAASTSLIVVYAWKDPLHFDYVHLSTDAAKTQPVHNGVFHVYGGDRVRISSDEGPASLADALRWTPVRIVYDASKGLVETWIDGRKHPSLRAADFSLGAGRVGLGSFFNTGSFRKFELQPGAC
jgi:hypothetical protein